MRNWFPIHPSYLDRQHLLGEHLEMHSILSIILGKKKGYRNHPEVIRWENSLFILKRRHDKVVEEMKRRGYNHKSPFEIDLKLKSNSDQFPPYIEPLNIMIQILNNKQR